MAEGRLLRQLLKAGSSGDSAAFRHAAERVISDERAKHHHLLANDLERILYGQSRHGDGVGPARDLPKDTERGATLLTVRQPLRDLKDIVLTDENRVALEALLLEQGRSELLASHGLRPINRLLLCGPPGCGKTTAAEVLATELSIELVIVRFDAVVSSFLGETAANMRKVFDFVSADRFVVLFDEFDAIGKERDDPGEHGELRRVVNAFLQMLDSYRGPSLLVAATNHERLLDRALWRRFDEVLLFEKPTPEEIKQLLAVKLRAVRHDVPVQDPSFLKLFRGLTHADVERVVVRAMKEMILQDRASVTANLLEEALKHEQKRQSLLVRPDHSPQR